MPLAACSCSATCQNHTRRARLRRLFAHTLRTFRSAPSVNLRFPYLQRSPRSPDDGAVWSTEEAPLVEIQC